MGQHQKKESSGIVEKERVVCQNCRYQYSFLYEAKHPVAKPAPTMTGTLDNYRNTRECYRACPNCGYHQDWMVQQRRKHRLFDFLLVCLIGACGVLLYMTYQMVAISLDPLRAGGFEPVRLTQWVFAGYLGGAALLAILYMIYLRWIWNPNRGVDTESYEAALPQPVAKSDMIHSLNQYEAAARLVTEVELPRSRPESLWGSLALTKKIFILIGVFLGIGSLLAPALSPDLAFTLANRGMTMLPFYSGIAFLAVSFLGGAWNLAGQRLK